MKNIIEHWNEILEKVRDEHDVSDVSFKTWLEPLQIQSLEGDTLYIAVSDQQQLGVNYIAKKFTDPLTVAVNEIIKPKNQYHIKFTISTPSSSINNKEETVKDNQEETSTLKPDYTFDTFVVGSNNRFAHSASLAVAETPGEMYNPLYIYGNSGLGKTHLMQAIAHFIKEQNPSSVVRYVSSEMFTNELIDAIGNNSTRSEFKKKYRNVDALLIDDIQFIMGKDRTQEEFFNIFNELHSTGKQVVITSDVNPNNLNVLEERLRTRLEWGLVVDINYPDYETRMAILRKKQELEKSHLSDEILDYIASNIKNNIRQLEGAFHKLVALANLENMEITYDVAVKELESFITPDKPKEITPDLIIQTVCDHYHISQNDIISSRRSAEIAYPRQIAMYLCYQLLEGVTYNGIGVFLGGKDHSTVMHGIKKITNDISTNNETRNNVDIIIKKITPL